MESFLDTVRRAATDSVPSDPGRVLEIGPGVGQWLLELFRARRPAAVVTIDVDPHVYLPDAARLPSLRVQADGLDLPFSPASFDTVVCVNVASILPHGALRRLIWQMQRVLRPGGTGVVSVQNRAHPVLFARIASQPRRYRSGSQPFAYRRGDVVRWIAAAGGRGTRVRPVSFGIPATGPPSPWRPLRTAVTAAHYHLVNRHAPFAPVLIASWRA